MRILLFSITPLVWLVHSLVPPPRSSFSTQLPALGELGNNCSRFPLDLLGPSGKSSRSGFIANRLLAEARTLYSLSDLYWPDDLPLVEILGYEVTCMAFGQSRNTFSSVSILALYSCEGVACEGWNGSVDSSQLFTRHFSFKCLSSGDWSEEWDESFSLISLSINISADTFIDTADSDGICSVCFNPAALSESELNAYDGEINWDKKCLECFPNCLSNGGQRACVANERSDDSTCCRWYHRGQCVYDCPAPYHVKNHTTFECQEKSIDVLYQDGNIPLCPGQTRSFKCFVFDPAAEHLQLMWHVTYPEHDPVVIMYDGNSTLSTLEMFRLGIHASLNNYTDGQFIESTITLEALRNIPLGSAEVECMLGGSVTKRVHMNNASYYGMPFPFAPLNFRVTEITVNVMNITCVVEWDEAPPSSLRPYSNVFSIVPDALSQTIGETPSSPFQMTLAHDILYHATLAAVNCAGRNLTSLFIDTSEQTSTTNFLVMWRWDIENLMISNYSSASPMINFNNCPTLFSNAVFRHVLAVMLIFVIELLVLAITFAVKKRVGGKYKVDSESDSDSYYTDEMEPGEVYTFDKHIYNHNVYDDVHYSEPKNIHGVSAHTDARHSEPKHMHRVASNTSQTNTHKVKGKARHSEPKHMHRTASSTSQTNAREVHGKTHSKPEHMHRTPSRTSKTNTRKVHDKAHYSKPKYGDQPDSHSIYESAEPEYMHNVTSLHDGSPTSHNVYNSESNLYMDDGTSQLSDSTHGAVVQHDGSQTSGYSQTPPHNVYNSEPKDNVTNSTSDSQHSDSTHGAVVQHGDSQTSGSEGSEEHDSRTLYPTITIQPPPSA